jgi:hypothetical protein
LGVKPLIEGGILYLEVIRQKEVPLAVPFVDEHGHRLDVVTGCMKFCWLGVKLVFGLAMPAPASRATSKFSSAGWSLKS